LTTNVALQDSVPGSLLNLYRRLIHLRKTNDALATGRLVPLSVGGSQVVAYLRRSGRHAVLVVANLGSTAASISITSADSVLAPGAYTARNLLGGPDAATLSVVNDGRIPGYAPSPLGPRESLVLEFVRR
jgi:maltooligosyltrehalose synthase